MAPTQAQIDIVKATIPILKEHGTTVTSTMYKNMIGNNPELRNVFSMRSQATGAQPAALAASVLAYATYIDDLPKLQHAVERIAQKHVSLFIQPDQYMIVAKYLIEAFGIVLGDAFTDEIKDAWVAAYLQLADVFIQREAALYKGDGEWTNWRDFKIVKKELENEAVASFYLEPVDGKPIPSYLPGQYISLQLPIPGVDFKQSRQFSLSEAPAKQPTYYRVSGDRPIVLLSAGVGATPMRSILDAVLASPTTGTRPIRWIHAARRAGTSLFVEHAREVAAKHENVTATIFLKEVKEGEVKGQAFDYEGRLDLGKLAEEKALSLENNGAEYFICGPESWMLFVKEWLLEHGVPLERQHLELFNTGDVV
uniref:nitric oxide dioxygenase n=1 Tax=Bionectria ochroleuca TaxID=29856 RepID=A0A0B7KIA1_BIOOC